MKEMQVEVHPHFFGAAKRSTAPPPGYMSLARPASRLSPASRPRSSSKPSSASTPRAPALPWRHRLHADFYRSISNCRSHSSSQRVSLQAQTPACSNAVFKGTYFFLVNGSVIPGNQVLPYGSLGKVVADGQGGIMGSAVTTVNGVSSAFTLTGTYSIAQNCTGTTTLTATSATTQPNTITVNLQVVDNGQSAVFAFSTSGQVIAGRGYQVTSTGTPGCTNGSFNGSYGYLFSGLLNGAPYAEEGQVVSTGTGNLSATSVVNLSGTLTPVPAHGTYTMASDCSGTAQLINQFGTHNFSFAVVEDGHLAVFSETDAGAVISGTASSQSPARVAPSRFRLRRRLLLGALLHQSNQQRGLVYGELLRRRQQRAERALRRRNVHHREYCRARNGGD